MRWLSEVRERLRTLVFGSRADAETAEEMRFHLEMEAERLEREEGLEAGAARRRAALAFGGMDRHALAVRDARGFGWLSGMSLDVKLGARMLRRYPGLTIAGGLAIALAVALAASFFEFFNDMASPRMPLPADVVAVQVWDRSAAQQERRALHDFAVWREEVETLRELSAVSTIEVQATTDAGRFALLRAARVTRSVLGVADFAPMLGRTFEAADEGPGAPLPVLIGHDVWQDLYDGDRSVVGRTLRVNDEPGTVVGVMPEGFGFPLNQQVWVPLRHTGRALEPRTGPPISVFGRLAPGTTLAEAQAELSAIGERMAMQHPSTHEHLRPRVRTLQEVVGMGGIVRMLNLPFILFLLVVCANVATLVFARTATRSGEIAVRSALGASRRRLVVQLVAEALVLTSLATAAGLALAQWGLRHGMALFWEVQQMAPPYFFDDDLAPITIVYALGLSVVAALVIGGVPALKATGRRLRLQLAQSPGGGGLRFGRVSTAVIVVQVALCVAFLPIAIIAARDLRPEPNSATSFPADRFLSGGIVITEGGAPVTAAARSGAAAAAGDAVEADLLGPVKQRLLEQPGVEAVAFVSRIPGFNHPVSRMQLESDSTRLLTVRLIDVDPDFFELVGARVVAGRTFHPGEYESEARAVIVSAEWAAEELPGGSPVGQRIRFAGGQQGGDAAWREIVGVVEGMPRAIGPGEHVGLYGPLRTTSMEALQFYARASVPPATLVRDVHTVVSGVDPVLVATDVKPLDEVWAPVLEGNRYFLAGLHVVAVVILGFALIGIYALLSFTVSQRAREIAIRAALGAYPGRIVMTIFSRAVAQIGLGVVIGATVVSLAVVRTPGGFGLVAGVAGLMMLFGLTGCTVPAVRALRIQPTDALKTE